MSLKSIELQVAIPKAQEASKLQEQMNRQGQQFQEKVSEEQLREEQLKRKQINKQEDVEKRGVTDEKNENSHANKIKAKKHKHKEQVQLEKTQHPYIGKRIDLTR